MSAIKASGGSLPAARCRLLGPGAGVEDTPRWAWPVLAKPSSRAVAESRIQDASTPSSTTARRRVATPSASNGRERNPRRRSGSSRDRKSTRLNSSHDQISYAVFCLKKKNEHRLKPFVEIIHKM